MQPEHRRDDQERRSTMGGVPSPVEKRNGAFFR
jgi:hypothetical protein